MAGARPAGRRNDALSFVSRRVGFALVGKRSTVMRTTSGARGWRATSTLPAAAPTLFGPTMGFTSARAGWAVSGSALEETQNSGRVWRAVQVPRGLDALAVSFSGSSGALLLAPPGGPVANPHSPTTLLMSADGGAAWSRRTIAGVSAMGVGMLGAGEVALDTPYGWLISTDGGRDWQWAGIP